MHAAFLIRSLQCGGAERAAVSLANGFVQAGHTSTLLVLTGDDSFYPVDARVRVCYLRGETIRAATKPALFLRRAAMLHNTLLKTRPDAVIGMSAYMSAYAAIAAIGTGAAAIGTERANPFILYADRKTTLLRKCAARLCRGFICQTEKALAFFPHAVQRKAAVIPNAVFNPLVYDTSVPNKRDEQITALGRLDHNKGFDLLLRAFAVVHAQAPEYTLTIFGDGPLRAELESLCRTLELSDCVRLAGADPEAILTIARSSLFVLSSRSEGMPNALMEAMAAGVPCVATDCEIGPSELITDGVNGLLVPPEDVDALAEAMLRVLRDPALSASLSCEALHIREAYGLQSITQRWAKYIEQILG